jgi:hypothetical protein
MRTSRALAVAAVVLAPTALVVVQAGPAAAWDPCGAITRNPHCAPDSSRSAPTFPYTSMFSSSMTTSSMTTWSPAAPATSRTLLQGLLPVASDADRNNGVPVEPMAAAGTVLGGLGTLIWFRRKRHSNS